MNFQQKENLIWFIFIRRMVMITKAKILNYVTILLAIATVGWSIYTSQIHGNPGMCILLLILTLIFRSMSKYETEKELFGTKREKEEMGQLLSQAKEKNTNDMIQTSKLEKKKKASKKNKEKKV